MNYQGMETELKKRIAFPYIWGTRQNDASDHRTRFIYSIQTWQELQSRIDELFKKETAYNFWFNYTINRWYNFWSAKAIENIFCSHAQIQKHCDPFDKEIDFYIGDVPFDHKTSKFPKGFNQSLDYAQQHSLELAYWFYHNQSQQGRRHLKNRLFVVLYNQADKGAHLKLKAELLWLKTIIEQYLETYDQKNLLKLSFNNKQTYSDIIWAIKK